VSKSFTIPDPSGIEPFDLFYLNAIGFIAQAEKPFVWFR